MGKNLGAVHQPPAGDALTQGGAVRCHLNRKHVLALLLLIVSTVELQVSASCATHSAVALAALTCAGRMQSARADLQQVLLRVAWLSGDVSL
jgi:hypothetical protein